MEWLLLAGFIIPDVLASESVYVFQPAYRASAQACISGDYAVKPDLLPALIVAGLSFDSTPYAHSPKLFNCSSQDPMILDVLEQSLHHCIQTHAMLCNEDSTSLSVLPLFASDVFSGLPPKHCPTCPSDYHASLLRMELEDQKLANEGLRSKIASTRELSRSERLRHMTLFADKHRLDFSYRSLRSEYRELLLLHGSC